MPAVHNNPKDFMNFDCNYRSSHVAAITIPRSNRQHLAHEIIYLVCPATTDRGGGAH